MTGEALVRPILRGISTGLMLLLIGCAVRPGETPSTLLPLEPEITTTMDATAAADEPFALYLLEGEISPGKIDSGSALVLMDKPLITVDDIIEYNAETHQIRLTENGLSKISQLQVPVNGKAFVICVNGEMIYQGAFWVSFSSLSYDGVVIDPLLTTVENPVIQISLGYPGVSFFTGDDPRSDPRILEGLEKSGKLH